MTGSQDGELTVWEIYFNDSSEQNRNPEIPISMLQDDQNNDDDMVSENYFKFSIHV